MSVSSLKSIFQNSDRSMTNGVKEKKERGRGRAWSYSNSFHLICCLVVLSPPSGSRVCVKYKTQWALLMLIYDSPTLWHSTALITSDADIDNNACDSLSMLNE